MLGLDPGSRRGSGINAIVCGTMVLIGLAMVLTGADWMLPFVIGVGVLELGFIGIYLLARSRE